MDTLVLARQVLLFAVSCVACGAPRGAWAGPGGVPSKQEPLVVSELADDASIVRAIAEHYTKYEFRIPMRDGIRLFTHVYAPKDERRTYPFLICRTPYGVGPYGVDNLPNKENRRTLLKFAPSAQFVREGYIFVHQDVRGRMMSEGEFVDIRPRNPGGIDESTDAFDTVAWLLSHVPGHNGRAGFWGISYPGYYAAMAAVNAHPAVKAVSPQAPVTEWFLGDDFHHNGAVALADAFDFYSNFGKPRPKPTPKATYAVEHNGMELYERFLSLGPLANVNDRHFKGQIAFWNQIAEHETRDEFWKVRDPRPHYAGAKPAVLTVGGLFDAEDLFGALETYRAFEHGGSKENVLVLGPWSHGGWARTEGDKLGDIFFSQKTSLHYRSAIELPFFERHLKGRGGAPLPEATAFETGTNRWRTFAGWPPASSQLKSLYFAPKGALSRELPAGEGKESYVSDPQRPVPYSARYKLERDPDYMTEDQRFASRRTDVLVYQTEPLTEDLTVIGPIVPRLWIASSGTDSDFVVKVIDVFPDSAEDSSGVRLGGYQMLVRGEIMRAKFRNSYEKPEPLVPDQPTELRFRLPDVLHTFRTGHRVMVQVQSSWFPLFDRNPQTFVNVFVAKEGDFRSATETLFFGGKRASRIEFLGLGH